MKRHPRPSQHPKEAQHRIQLQQQPPKSNTPYNREAMTSHLPRPGMEPPTPRVQLQPQQPPRANSSYDRQKLTARMPPRPTAAASAAQSVQPQPAPQFHSAYDRQQMTGRMPRVQDSILDLTPPLRTRAIGAIDADANCDVEIVYCSDPKRTTNQKIPFTTSEIVWPNQLV